MHYKKQMCWHQRIASLMIVVMLISSLTCNVPIVYAAEGVAEPFSINYTEEEYSVTTEVAEEWDTGYNIRITINNTSDETIHNWGILFETKDEIRDLYNAQVLSNEDGVYLLRNSVYNQDIPAGESVTFGYTGYYTEEPDIPEEYVVSSIETAVEIEGFLVSYILCDSWDSGAIAQILIENTSDKTIEDWILEFDSGIEITKIWDAELVSHEGEHYVIRNVPYAHNIMAGSTAVAGLHLLETPEMGEDEDVLTNIIVREILPDGSGQGNGNGDENNPSVSDNDATGEGEEDKDDDVSGNVVPDEDIVHLEMEEGLGEIYYKTAYEDDVVSDPDGLPCIKNQFLLSADDTVDFWYVESYLSELGAVIVGYIEAINNYQVEMIEDTDVYAIQELAERISNEAWVDYAGFNYLWLEEPCFHTTDPWTERGYNDGELYTRNPQGNNWGLELIDFEGALINAGVISSSKDSPDDIVTDHLTTVRMGIYDTSFDVWHEDLSANFVRTWQNYVSQNDLMLAYEEAASQDDDLRPYYHGTHVAGTMCAVFNNGIGINGICIKNELYGFADGTSYKSSIFRENGEVVNSTYSIICGFSALIEHDVKVINYSMGYKGTIAYAASVDKEGEEGHDNAINYLEEQSKFVAIGLNKFLKLGYDFLIVVIAGNNNDDIFYKCDITNTYIAGYIPVSEANKLHESELKEYNIETGTVYEADGNVMAQYHSAFTYISPEERCYDHIICVGSVSSNHIGGFVIADYSNTGDRVDIYAPGSEIYSTYLTAHACFDSMASDSDINYISKNGTSMAAPHVSGTAGLAYNVDPNISATELKNIIIDNASIIQDAVTDNDINVLNAADVIAAVIAAKNANSGTGDAIMLHVTDSVGMSIPGARIEIRDKSDYYFFYAGYAYFITPTIGGTVICSDILTDEDGLARLDLPEGEYYALIYDDNGESDNAVMHNFTVTADDITNRTIYETALESYSTEEEDVARMYFASSSMHRVNNVTVRFRSGWNQYDGAYAVNSAGTDTFATGMYGNLFAELPRGAYTMEITWGDKPYGYSNVYVGAGYYAYQLD